MHTLESVFNKICRWCGAPRFPLPSQTLICPNCDYAVNDKGIASTIPNNPVDKGKG
jgi:hypothetical protein